MREAVVWIIYWPSWKDVHLPDSVTQPSSLMTCGCGLSVFISSSSDFKSRLSDSPAFATMKTIKGMFQFLRTAYNEDNKRNVSIPTYGIQDAESMKLML